MFGSEGGNVKSERHDERSALLSGRIGSALGVHLLSLQVKSSSTLRETAFCVEQHDSHLEFLHKRINLDLGNTATRREVKDAT